MQWFQLPCAEAEGLILWTLLRSSALRSDLAGAFLPLRNCRAALRAR